MNKSIIIVGGGPGGISTAIQLHRSGLKPLIFEAHQLGGLLVNAWRVENYPGFPKGISGVELGRLFREQMEGYQPEIVYDHVLSIERKNNRYFLKTKKGNLYTCQFLVIATGTIPKQFANFKPDQSHPLSQRIHYEIDSIRQMKAKDISIIGGSDVAFDYALTMSTHNRVSIFMRGSQSKAIKALRDTIEKKNTIKVFPRTQVKQIQLKDDRITLQFKPDAFDDQYRTDYLLVAIGRQPTMPYLINRSEMDAEREKTVFFVGDVKNKRYRQVSFAVADGIQAAMVIDSMLQGGQS